MTVLKYEYYSKAKTPQLSHATEIVFKTVNNTETEKEMQSIMSEMPWEEVKLKNVPFRSAWRLYSAVTTTTTTVATTTVAAAAAAAAAATTMTTTTTVVVVVVIEGDDDDWNYDTFSTSTGAI